MRRVTSSCSILSFFFLACAAFAQTAPIAATATCNIDDNKQLVVDYQRVTVNLKKPLSQQIRDGKPWAPGGKPMTFFTNTPVEIGGHNLSIGAYTLFLIPGSKQWTLIVSKSTDMTGAYEETQDLVRVPMDSGELPTPEAELSVGLEHAGPGQCNIRVDLEKAGHFATFRKQ
jgi:hypothetical protein